MTFIKKHWKAIVIAVMAIILIIVVVNVIKHLSGANSNVTAGTSGIATLDGSAVGVFDNQKDAEANKVTVDAGTKKLVVSGSGNIDASATVGGFPASILTETKDGHYDVALDGLGDGTTVIVKMLVGGDGSWVGQRLSGDVDEYYLAITVSNPQQNQTQQTQGQTTSPSAQTAQTLGVPNGQVYLGEEAYQTYGSETEAQQAVASQQNAFTLPVYMVQNGLKVTAVPTTDDTARIWVKITMVDNEGVDRAGVCVNPENDWSDVLDVSEFAGHQVTLMLKAENGWAISSGFSYVSFYLPQFETQEEIITPIVGAEGK